MYRRVTRSLPWLLLRVQYLAIYWVMYDCAGCHERRLWLRWGMTSVIDEGAFPVLSVRMPRQFFWFSKSASCQNLVKWAKGLPGRAGCIKDFCPYPP